MSPMFRNLALVVLLVILAGAFYTLVAPATKPAKTPLRTVCNSRGLASLLGCYRQVCQQAMRPDESVCPSNEKEPRRSGVQVGALGAAGGGSGEGTMISLMNR
ncbi:hypothetical protein QWE_06533 [Agrobacterium albertimagni AOL15]|uniref:Uncharacterized protein n=1 Tax=Agrobacterium albertimagni AOL15 TaxID=1156935 RepID=K2QYM3_9HYPH|nr:hypothetical protein QWE_06533 [Agrobacterium albertimagni AOL15]